MASRSIERVVLEGSVAHKPVIEICDEQIGEQSYDPDLQKHWLQKALAEVTIIADEVLEEKKG